MLLQSLIGDIDGLGVFVGEKGLESELERKLQTHDPIHSLFPLPSLLGLLGHNDTLLHQTLERAVRKEGK